MHGYEVAMNSAASPTHTNMRADVGVPLDEAGGHAGRVAIDVSDVSKQFVAPDGSIQEVLHRISCQFVEGHLTCLLGPTGCGKSTLLNLIAGFEPPTSGRIVVHGQEVTKPSRERMVVFQDAGSA